MAAALRFRRGRGVVFRATTYDTPLWVSPNSRQGRWSHPQDAAIAQYTALDVAGAIAEMVRSEELRNYEEARELRVSVWELRIDEGAIADFSTPSAAEQQGVNWRDLLADDWTECQTVGTEIVSGGGRGVLAPSASLPGSRCLTLFGPRTEIAWSADPRLAIQVPARHILRGEPGRGIVRDTRFFGDPHPEDAGDTTTRHETFEWIGEPASGYAGED
jgi:RES domain-containing protein